jgi:hypothetical protein
MVTKLEISFNAIYSREEISFQFALAKKVQINLKNIDVCSNELFGNYKRVDLFLL